MWQPIETAPDAERVWVCGYDKRMKYWWYHEDVVFNGIGTDHEYALYWAKIVIPEFPEAPK